MDSQSVWPALIHKKRAWVEAYEHGWTQLQAIVTEEAWTDKEDLPWAIYCARYLWQRWRIEAALDSVYAKEGTNSANDPPLAWLEWECFRLSGNCERLHRTFPLLWEAWQALQRGKDGEFDALTWLIQSQALAEISHALKDPLPGVIHKKEILPDLHSFLEEMQKLPADSSSVSIWLERALLLLSLLRSNHDAVGYQHLLRIAVDLCVSQPQLHRYLPPLLIDGVIGCVPNGGERYLTWWLYADPPLGIERYALGIASLSLHAKREEGVGTRITAETSAPAILEIITAERSYLELLDVGKHELTLTVLDRTDVR
jgi:hypothetical protein